MFKERLIISILITTLIMTSFHSNWLQFLQANAKETYMREAFAINNSTFHQKMKVFFKVGLSPQSGAST